MADRFGKVLAVVGGGNERALSVREGLRVLEKSGTWELVGVHDGVRPLVTCEEVGRAVSTLLAEPELAGVVLAMPNADTIKAVDADGYIIDTPDRDSFVEGANAADLPVAGAHDGVRAAGASPREGHR